MRHGITLILLFSVFFFGTEPAYAQAAVRVVIANPTAGQQVTAGNTVQVQWRTPFTAATAGYFSLYYKPGAGSWAKIQEFPVPSGNTQTSWQTAWVVPSVNGKATLFVGYDKGDRGTWEANSLVEVSVSPSGGPGNGTPPPIGTGSITVTSPNGGEIWKQGETRTISWQANGISAVNLQVECAGAGGSIGFANTFTSGTGAYSWFINPALYPPASDCKIRVLNSAQTADSDASDNAFTILAPVRTLPAVSIFNPTSGQKITVGSTMNIQWTATPAPTAGRFSLQYRASGGSWIKIQDGANKNATSVSWTAPNTPGSFTLFLGYDIGDRGAWEAYTTTPFTIVTSGGSASPIPTIAITQPAANQRIKAGSSITIGWSAEPTPTSGRFSIAINRGSGWEKLYDIINLTGTTASWSVPQTRGSVTLFVGYDRGDRGAWEAHKTINLTIEN